MTAIAALNDVMPLVCFAGHRPLARAIAPVRPATSERRCQQPWPRSSSLPNPSPSGPPAVCSVSNKVIAISRTDRPHRPNPHRARPTSTLHPRGFVPWRFADAGPGLHHAVRDQPASATLHRCGPCRDTAADIRASAMLLAGVGLPPCAATLRPWATNPDAPGKCCPVVITSALCGYHIGAYNRVHITEGAYDLWRLARAVGEAIQQ
jgi:hypothetical protein